MKKILIILIVFSTAVSSCIFKDEVADPVIGVFDQPVLENLSETELILEKAGAEERFIDFSWSEADFGFQSAITYNLQIDRAGSDFSDPIELATVSELSAEISHASLNEKLVEAGFETNEPAEMEIRVEATVNPDVQSLYSQIQNVTITPYASTFPPIYMIGASVGGWDPAKAVELVSTGEPYKYITIAEFTVADGTNFRFFRKPSWDASLGGYDVFTNYPEDLLEPATSDSDPNFNFIGTPGWYQMSVDTETGTIEMEATSKPEMFLTGDATHGWSWDDPVTELNLVSYNIWEGDVEFTQGGAFRLFAQKDWGPDSYGYDVVVNYDTNYIDEMDGHDDPNWEFLKPSGTYHVVVNLRDNSIEISEP